MSREDPQLKVRLPQDLKDKITESASNLGRSINADVVARLEGSFEPQGNEQLLKKINEMSSELINLSREAREMRMLYIEAINNNYENLPISFKSNFVELIRATINEKFIHDPDPLVESAFKKLLDDAEKK